MAPDDEFVRESLDLQCRPPRPPQSVGRIALLAALAGLMVLTIAGTTALVVRDLRLSQTAGVKTTIPGAVMTTTRPSGTLTRDPSGFHSWSRVSGGGFADVQLTQGSGQRRYLCGRDVGTSTRLVGVTTDGRNTWQRGPSPAGYDYCSLQVSATNPLDVVLISSVAEGCSCPGFDAHYQMIRLKTPALQAWG
jgi:hypothetical protein